MLLSRHLGPLFSACLALVLASGCGPGGLRAAREDRDPLLRRARDRKNAQDIPGAVAAYQRALDKRPHLAGAHLELGWIYDHDLEDYVRALYHYQRYLDMRPEADKEDLVKDLIQHARISFAASLPDRPNQAIQQIALLKNENAALRAQLESGAAKPPAAPAASVAPSAAPVPVPPAQLPLSEMTPYVVQPGDTLSRIAGKVYGDSKNWQPIYDANRGALQGGPQSVRAGQTLMVPKVESR